MIARFHLRELGLIAAVLACTLAYSVTVNFIFGGL